MARLLLADRVKGLRDSFLAPLITALQSRHEVRFVALGPGDDLAQAIQWAEIVWLEWCWDHAVWATQSGLLAGRGCILRLHSVEALQTDYPRRIDWSSINALVTVGPDIAELIQARFPACQMAPMHVIANGIDLDRFTPEPGQPADRFAVAWVGHIEPKKNPMLLLQVAHHLLRVDPRYRFHVAGPFTDPRTARYVERMVESLGLRGKIRFDGQVDDMPGWYRSKGVLLSTTMYESFGMNIGEAMAAGAFPVIHDFPGARQLWPEECLFASIDDAAALIRSARPGLYRDWVAERYGLDRQIAAVFELVDWVKETQQGKGGLPQRGGSTGANSA